jgi:hypothetical protein
VVHGGRRRWTRRPPGGAAGRGQATWWRPPETGRSPSKARPPGIPEYRWFGKWCLEASGHPWSGPPGRHLSRGVDRDARTRWRAGSESDAGPRLQPGAQRRLELLSVIPGRFGVVMPVPPRPGAGEPQPQALRAGLRSHDGAGTSRFRPQGSGTPRSSPEHVRFLTYGRRWGRRRQPRSRGADAPGRASHAASHARNPRDSRPSSPETGWTQRSGDRRVEHPCGAARRLCRPVPTRDMVASWAEFPRLEQAGSLTSAPHSDVRRARMRGTPQESKSRHV